MSNKIINIMIY